MSAADHDRVPFYVSLTYTGTTQARTWAYIRKLKKMSRAGIARRPIARILLSHLGSIRVSPIELATSTQAPFDEQRDLRQHIAGTDMAVEDKGAPRG